MTDDLVKRLQKGQKYLFDMGQQESSIAIGQAMGKIKRSADRISELEGNIKDYLEGDYPHPRTYRPDQCPHDKYYYDDCHDCDFEYWKSKGFGQ